MLSGQGRILLPVWFSRYLIQTHSTDMPVFWLSEDSFDFPPPDLANTDGILAIGGGLEPERLLRAYSQGIFPWYNEFDPIMWWSPDPRFVLFPNELKVSRSMRPYFNQNKFKITFDKNFTRVIEGCQKPREGQSGGTWITPEMVESYQQLFIAGWAHSVEVWQEEELVGGLYGIALGKCFFGESMFSEVNNASKFGFISLVQILEKAGYWLIDCQQQTNYLKSLGARPIPRVEFLNILEKNLPEVKKDKKGTGFSMAVRAFSNSI